MNDYFYSLELQLERAVQDISTDRNHVYRVYMIEQIWSALKGLATEENQ